MYHVQFVGHSLPPLCSSVPTCETSKRMAITRWTMFNMLGQTYGIRATDTIEIGCASLAARVDGGRCASVSDTRTTSPNVDRGYCFGRRHHVDSRSRPHLRVRGDDDANDDCCDCAHDARPYGDERCDALDCGCAFGCDWRCCCADARASSGGLPAAYRRAPCGGVACDPCRRRASVCARASSSNSRRVLYANSTPCRCTVPSPLWRPRRARSRRNNSPASGRSGKAEGG